MNRASRSAAAIAALSVGALLLFLLLALLAVNLIVVPRIVAQAVRSTESGCDCTATVTRARYFPLRGISLRRVEIESGGVQTSVERARMRIPVKTLSRADEFAAISLPDLTLQNAAEEILSLLESIARAHAFPTTIVVDGISIFVPVAGGAPVGLGISRLRVVHDASAGTVSVTSRDDAADSLSIDLELAYLRPSISGGFAVRHSSLTRDQLSIGAMDLMISFRTVEPNLLWLAGDITLLNVAADLPAFSDETIGEFDLRYEFGATINPGSPDPATGGIEFSHGELFANGVSLSVIPHLDGLPPAARELRLELGLPETKVQQILASVPTAISGDLSGSEVAGSLRWDLSLRVPLESISDMEWSADTVLNDLAVTAIHPSMNVYEMNGTFVHTIRDESYQRTIELPPAREATMDWMLLHSEHSARQISRSRSEAAIQLAIRPSVALLDVSDPGAAGTKQDVDVEQAPPPVPDPGYHYVYVDEMSPWIVRAILTAEDGDFFFYGGINPVTLADAIELNVEAGEILFGASTISMQLIKMLYLDQARIFSRKFQELCLVYLMEHHVPVSKERILELYINLAEFGPGVFGIYDASHHYFGKHPAYLTSAEATFLASILPAPKTYYQQFVDGRVSDDGFARMVNLFKIMLERERMTQVEYDQAVSRRPGFVTTESASE